MQEKLGRLLCNFPKGHDGIYSSDLGRSNVDQAAERETREQVAAQHYEHYLEAIEKSHSIPVMDYEVDRFLSNMPYGAAILDIGGCWGWHWRRLASTRPDVGVVIIDFVRSNLVHCARVLGPLVGGQVALMHADATALPFADASRTNLGFEGVWTVQTFQHIPDFPRACREAHRVLDPGGLFANYSLHNTPINRLIYRVFGKSFHSEGMVKDAFYLSRANDTQRNIVADTFRALVVDRYTECLFHPDLKLGRAGRRGSLLGIIDSHLGNSPSLGRWIARQRSFEVAKSKCNSDSAS